LGPVWDGFDFGMGMMETTEGALALIFIILSSATLICYPHLVAHLKPRSLHQVWKTGFMVDKKANHLKTSLGPKQGNPKVWRESCGIWLS
jgi:hypothetical protein